MKLSRPQGISPLAFQIMASNALVVSVGFSPCLILDSLWSFLCVHVCVCFQGISMFPCKLLNSSVWFAYHASPASRHPWLSPYPFWCRSPVSSPLPSPVLLGVCQCHRSVKKINLFAVTFSVAFTCLISIVLFFPPSLRLWLIFVFAFSKNKSWWKLRLEAASVF